MAVFGIGEFRAKSESSEREKIDPRKIKEEKKRERVEVKSEEHCVCKHCRENYEGIKVILLTDFFQKRLGWSSNANGLAYEQ